MPPFRIIHVLPDNKETIYSVITCKIFFSSIVINGGNIHVMTLTGSKIDILKLNDRYRTNMIRKVQLMKVNYKLINIY